jgi:hypothetical protein
MTDLAADDVTTPEPEPPEFDGLEEQPKVRGSNSLLDDLHRKRDEIAQRAAEGADVLDLDVPGYGGRLFVRYEYPEGGWERLKRIQDAAQQSRHPLSELYAHTGIVRACTREVLGRTDGVEEKLDAMLDEPLRFDARLAALLRIEIPDSIDPKERGRFIVRQVFSPEAERTGVFRGDVSVSAHAIRVAAWVETREGSANDEFVGES